MRHTTEDAKRVGLPIAPPTSRRWCGVAAGILAGAGTATPALAAVQEAAKCAVRTPGYGVAYAVGNVLLALWDSMIVALIP